MAGGLDELGFERNCTFEEGDPASGELEGFVSGSGMAFDVEVGALTTCRGTMVVTEDSVAGGCTHPQASLGLRYEFLLVKQ